MKIVNPNHVSVVEQFVEDKKAGIASYLQNKADQETIEFDQVRADFPGIANDLTDGMISEISRALGIDVVI